MWRHQAKIDQTCCRLFVTDQHRYDFEPALYVDMDDGLRWHQSTDPMKHGTTKGRNKRSSRLAWIEHVTSPKIGPKVYRSSASVNMVQDRSIRGCNRLLLLFISCCNLYHDDVIKWKHFPCYWPFVKGIHWWPVDSPHTGQWRGALMISLTCDWNKQLRKQSWCRWFEMPSRSLWRHSNDNVLVGIWQRYLQHVCGMSGSASIWIYFLNLAGADFLEKSNMIHMYYCLYLKELNPLRAKTNTSAISVQSCYQ